MADAFTDVQAKPWDVIVVGAGLAGSTFGHRLARSGRRVLFLERGLDPEENPNALKGDFLEVLRPGEGHGGDEAHRHAGRFSRRLWDAHRKRWIKPLLGQGAGGSSALYGMVMERFWPQDFEPRRWHPGADGSALPDRWPFSFRELEPYYEEAETLYRVTGAFPDPLRADQRFRHRPGPDPNPNALRLRRRLEKKGLHPYGTPLALDWAEGCRFCQSFLCDKGCKNDAAKICLTPARREHGAALLTNADVLRLEADHRRVTGVHVRFPEGVRVLRAREVVLAAGALATPLILLRSRGGPWPEGLANRSGAVGRYLMRHYIDLLAVFSRRRFPPHVNLKELSLGDFYIREGEKFGVVGAFGHLPPAAMVMEDIEDDLRAAPRPVRAMFQWSKPLVERVVGRVLQQAGYLALILEDLPYADNRIEETDGPEGPRWVIHTRVREWNRVRRFRRWVKRALWPNPTLLLPQADNTKFLAHACGTCRMGDDPAISVVDRWNRAHGVENLHVIDASFFPSSGGMNPALTLAANALRVADRWLEENR